MKNDLICVDGRICSWEESGIGLVSLPGADFIYQRLHALDHRPLNRDAHIEIAEISWGTLYGGTAGISQEMLDGDTAKLLEANRYRMGSHLLTLYLFPENSLQSGVSKVPRPVRVLACERQLLYRVYPLGQKPLRVISTPYEYPFTPHKTAVSLAAHNYAAGYAQRKGADAAITTNFRGQVIGLGEDPLFLSIGNQIFTTPLDHGAAQSVERQLGIAACERAGMTVFEQAIEAAQLHEFEELFAVTPQGVTSIGQYSNRLYPHTLGKKIAESMAKLTL